MSTTRLQLFYSSRPVGVALVDRELSDRLSPSYLWTVEIPRTLRRLHPERPDIIAARLAEEPDTLSRCHPFLQYRGLVIRLSHLALRPQVADLLLELSVSTTSADALRLQIRAQLSSLLRVSFVNRSRVDCRVSNLREVSVPEDYSDDLGDTHPSQSDLSIFDPKEFLR